MTERIKRTTAVRLPAPTPIEGESLQAFRAFRKYAQLGHKRSQLLVSRRLGISRQLCSRWSVTHRWIERLRELEIAALKQENEAHRIADQKAEGQVAQQIERERLRFVRRQMEASEKATAKALEILNQPFGKCTPPEAARLLAVAHSIGANVFGLQSATPHTELQPISARQVTNIVIRRDEQSLKAMRIYSDFFKQHPDHPQAQRYIREYEEELEARGLPLGCQPNEQPPLPPDGEAAEVAGRRARG